MRREAEGLMADAAFWAASLSMGNRVPLLAGQLGLSIASCVGMSDALGAKSRLELAGVMVDTHGSVRYTQAALDEYNAGPWKADLAADQFGAAEIKATAATTKAAAAEAKSSSRQMQNINSVQPMIKLSILINFRAPSPAAARQQAASRQLQP